MALCINIMPNSNVQRCNTLCYSDTPISESATYMSEKTLPEADECGWVNSRQSN